MEEKQESQNLVRQKARKRPVRAEYHFPIYPLSVALEVTEKVEMEGGGSLSEAALARALGASAKSSGFQLKVLTAKQFGLLAKQGDNLLTTPIAKSIFKPTSDTDKAAALVHAFSNIHLFRAVSDRYAGSPLPPSEALRNILEREFKITPERVSSAESMLINSAKTAGVLQESHGKLYLVRESIEGIEIGVPRREELTPPIEEKPEKVLSSDELKRIYLRRLIEQVSPPDTAGKDAEAIKAETELRKAELDRIERLLKIETENEKEKSAEEDIPF